MIGDARRLPIAGALALMLAAPARADSGDAVLEQMRAAVASATSFRVYHYGPLSMTWIVIQPDRVRRLSPADDGTHDWIMIGHQSYERVGNGRWRSSWRDIEAVRYEEIAPFLRAGATAEVLANRIEAGTAVGVLDVLIPPYPMDNGRSIQPFHLVCSYDPATYYPRICTLVTISGARTTTRYQDWNDAANAVEPPRGVGTPTPPPA